MILSAAGVMVMKASGKWQSRGVRSLKPGIRIRPLSESEFAELSCRGIRIRVYTVILSDWLRGLTCTLVVFTMAFIVGRQQCTGFK